MITFRKTSIFIIAAIVLVANGLRFFDLERTPKGFSIDEIGTVLSSYCLPVTDPATHIKTWPVFNDIGFGSPYPLTLIYPMHVWSHVFGISTGATRAFEAFIYILALFGVFFLARLLGGSACAWLSLLAASISPWGWMFSRIAFEAILAPSFLVWGAFFFLRNKRGLDMLLAALMIAGAMYTYAPMRLYGPLLILLMFAYQSGRSWIPWRRYFGFFLALVLLCVPMALGYLHGELQGRFSGLSIGSPDYLRALGKTNSFADLAGVFLNNFFCTLIPSSFLHVAIIIPVMPRNSLAS